MIEHAAEELGKTDMNDLQPVKTGRTWLYIALGFVVFWGLYVTFFNPFATTSGPQLDHSAALQPADFTWRLLDLEDKPVELSRYRGKTIFLNVWATWCGPCVQEMPSIAALSANPALKDVAFLCVSTDDSADVVKGFLAGKNWPMTVLRANDVPPVFKTEGIPATFVIAPDGAVAGSKVGSVNWDQPEVVALLQKLAKP